MKSNCRGLDMNLRTIAVGVLLIILASSTELAFAQKSGEKKPASSSSAFLKTEKDELESIISLPAVERVVRLKEFISKHPRSPLVKPAQELLVSAHATLGDEKLRVGDVTGGAEEFRLAMAAIPTAMSDKLFEDVVSQIPSNLFLRGQQAASLEAARLIENRIKDNPKRLLAIAAFYVGVEAATDALRSADLAIKLAPDTSAAYLARASAYRIALKLEESASDYARAFELDPKSESARRSLAELRRATGKAEEALPLYREILAANPTDEFARTGMVVSLFELGKKDEAERELEAALKDIPNGLALLTGVAYWFAAHNQSARAVELAQRAVQLEPRYTWAHIALARALLGQKRPMDAERALLMARKYGRFPTLDYEMATVLGAAGLYDEAATVLSSSFALKMNQIETYLAGRTLAQANSFTDLLAPERRASIFQFTAADSEASAASLKSLLSFSIALSPSTGKEAIKEADVIAAAREFVSAADEMRAYRRLYVASRLLEADVALPFALEQLEAVTGEVDAALSMRIASVAVIADELHDSRARANAYDSVISVPEIPRGTLSNIIRGRIEDLAGWTLFHQGKYTEAIVRLRRATSVLPDKTIWWRNSMWHLGASLEASKNLNDALESYFKSYRGSDPDPTRRAVIESLYRRINGSLDGLDEKIGASPFVASNTTTTPATGTGTEANSTAGTAESKQVEVTQSTESGPASSSDVSEAKPAASTPSDIATTETKSEAKPVEMATESSVTSGAKVDTTGPTPSETPASISNDVKTDSTEAKQKVSLPKSDSTPEIAVEAKSTDVAATPSASPSPEPTPTDAPIEVPPGPPQRAVDDEPVVTKTPTGEPAKPTTEPTKDAAPKQRQRRVSDTKCSITTSESELTIQNNGGRALISISLDGASTTNGVSAATSDWSSLAVFPEPKSGAESTALVYSVTSISKKTGLFTITFKSPCGTKDVAVTVK